MSNKPLEKISIIPQDDAPITNLPQANSSSIAKMDPLVAMIERAARDPSIDMDRLERLITMQERSAAGAAEGVFNDAMSAIQLEITSIARDSYNPQTRSKYASYHAVDKAIRPAYGKHGLSVSFDEDSAPIADHVRVWALVSKGRHISRFHYDSPIVTTGMKGNVMMTPTHAKASAVTYAKRYLMGMIFNLSTGEDTDGNVADTAAEKPTITQDQADQLRDILETNGKDRAAFLKWVGKAAPGVEQIESIPADLYQSCVDAANYKAPSK